MKLAIPVLALFLIVAAAGLAPVQPYQDFQVLFHADLGLLQGIALYDQPAQVDMIAGFAGVAPNQVYVLPFPYPPWYALSTMWLALLPVATAARVWFGLNLLMLVASIVLLTSDETPRKRAALLLGGVFWLPVLGSLLVGQYGFPVLLGAALMAHALRRENPVLLALAVVLQSFKPHLGAAMVLVLVLHLAARRDRFARTAGLALLAAGAILLGLGFLASPVWPVAYGGSLASFRGVHGVPQCTQCVSMPVMLARIAGGGLSTATWIALVFAVLASVWLFLRGKPVLTRPMALASIGVLATLLVSPYLLNYDYLLLVVPLIALARKAPSLGAWIALAFAYLLPPVALALWASAGNPALIASTCIVSVLMLQDVDGAADRAVLRSA